MHRFVVGAFLLLCLLAAPLYAVRITSVEDVVRMYRAGVSEELILAMLEDGDEPLEVTRRDIAWMEREGLPDEVIDAVLAASERNAEGVDAAAPSLEPRSEEAEQAAEPVVADATRTFDPPVERLYPQHFLVPPWAWDPWWFMPRLDSTIGQEGDAAKAPSARSEEETRAVPSPRHSAQRPETRERSAPPPASRPESREGSRPESGAHRLRPDAGSTGRAPSRAPDVPRP